MAILTPARTFAGYCSGNVSANRYEGSFVFLIKYIYTKLGVPMCFVYEPVSSRMASSNQKKFGLSFVCSGFETQYLNYRSLTLNFGSTNDYGTESITSEHVHQRKQPSLSERILRTGPAIIDEITQKYGSSVDINLCQGAPRVGISQRVQEKVAEMLRDSQMGKQVSEYGDLVGLTQLRKLWGNVIVHGYRNEPELDLHDLQDLENLFPSHELMIAAGANQGFVNVILTICDHKDEVILILPYYLSHVNALVMTGVTPIPVPVDDKTFLPRIEDIEARITERSKAVVLVNPGNPSGVVIPKELVEQVSSLCKNHELWLILDEAYREFLYGNEPGLFSPDPDAHIIKLYTMSKVYGLAGWRVGAILYPKPISATMNKVQDTIPTHASIISQIVASEALKDNPLHGKDCYVNELRFVRSCFLEHLKNVYSTDCASFVVPDCAFYFFLPHDELGYTASKTESEDRYAVHFLATKFHVLVPVSLLECVATFAFLTGK